MNPVTTILRSFEVHNFKVFRRERLDLHPDVTVLVGRNDVGKSILLNAIELYGVILDLGFRWSLSDPRFLTTGAEVTRFVAHWSVGGELWVHHLVLDADAPEERFEHGNRFWSWNPKERILRTERAEFSVPKLKQYATMGAIEEFRWKLDTDVPEAVYGPLRKVAETLATPVPYLFEPSALCHAAALDIRTPNKNGFGWAVWLQEIINRRDDDLTRLETHIRELFPFFDRIRVREERVRIEREIAVLGQRDGDMERTPGDIPETWLDSWRMQQSRREVLLELGEGFRIDAPSISSGLLLALAHFALLYADSPGRLMLLEEPENGLNPKITLNMMESFLQAARARKRQLILTTHNAWWLDLVEPESIRVLTRDRSGAHIGRPRPDTVRRLRDELDVYPSEVVSVFGPEQLLRPLPPEIME